MEIKNGLNALKLKDGVRPNPVVLETAIACNTHVVMVSGTVTGNVTRPFLLEMKTIEIKSEQM